MGGGGLGTVVGKEQRNMLPTKVLKIYLQNAFLVQT